MLKPYCFLLLVSSLADGGAEVPPSNSPGGDAGVVVSPPVPSGADAGPPRNPASDAGHVHWPENLRPLAILDGPAVLAAHAVLQQVLSRFPKEYVGSCSYSAKAMEVIVGEEGGVYFVRVNRREDKCGWVAPGVNTDLDWFEMYAVSPEGRILERYPYFP